jgi:hypothetical protein
MGGRRINNPNSGKLHSAQVHESTTSTTANSRKRFQGVRDMKVVIREFPFFVAFNLA